MAKWLNLLMYTEVVRRRVLCFLIPECIPSSCMDYSIGYGVSCKLSYIANVMVDMCLVPELVSIYDRVVLNVCRNCNNLF